MKLCFSVLQWMGNLIANITWWRKKKVRDNISLNTKSECRHDINSVNLSQQPMLIVYFITYSITKKVYS